MTPKSQPNLILKSQQPKLKPKSSPTYSRVPAARHDPNLMPPNSIKLKRFHPKHVLGMLAESTRRRSHRVRQKRKPEGEAWQPAECLLNREVKAEGCKSEASIGAAEAVQGCDAQGSSMQQDNMPGESIQGNITGSRSAQGQTGLGQWHSTGEHARQWGAEATCAMQ